MKISIFVLLVIILEFSSNSIASPPKGGIGDGYIYPVKSSPSKPKSTTTYYAKPLHPPARKPSRPAPKAKVYKVIIQNQPAAQSHKQEEIFKIIRLNGGSGGGGGGAGSGSHGSKSVKILKIIHLKQQPNGGGHGSGGHGSGGHGSGGHGSGGHGGGGHGSGGWSK